MAKKSLYPTNTLEDTLTLARTIVEHNSGKPMRRITLFDTLKKSPDSGTSRALVTSSSGYGLTEGSYAAESLKLTDRGDKIISQNNSQSKIDAILDVPIFKAFFEQYVNSGVPSDAAAIDFLKTQGVEESRAKDCLKVLLANGRWVKLIKETSGKERVLTVAHALEELGGTDDVEIVNDTEGLDKPKSLLGNIKPVGALKGLNMPALNINIQIELPGNATPEQYESIFKNMRKYLLDENNAE